MEGNTIHNSFKKNLTVITVSFLLIQMKVSACAIPEPDYYTINPIYASSKEYNELGYVSVNEFLNHHLNATRKFGSGKLELEVPQLVENSAVTPITILINNIGSNDKLKKIDLFMFGRKYTSITNNIHPYLIASFTLEESNISEIKFRIKMLELSANIFAVGKIVSNSHEIRYIVSDNKLIKTSGFCGGDIFVPTKSMADKLNGILR